ncbi:type II secretion system protein [Verrucomicrobiota bacterium]
MNTGFTLIEVLVALLLLTIVLSVALESQVTAIKIERAARAVQAVRFEIDRVLVETLCGQAATNTRDAVTRACDVHQSSVQVDKGFTWVGQESLTRAGAGSAELIKWEIVPKDRPSLRTVMFSHPFPK